MLKTATFSGTNPVVGDLTVLGTELVGPVGGNQVTIAGNTTGNGVLLGAAVGSVDANVNLVLSSKGAGSIQMQTGFGAWLQIQIVHTASSVNFLNLTGGATGGPPSIKAYSVTDTNVGLSLVPQGTGALMAAIPDNASTGGNARGTSAVDLQLGRTAAANVASGSSSFAAGYDNRASGANSVAAGNANIATGSGAVAIGTAVNATAQYAVALGYATTADGQRSIAMGAQSATHGNFGAQVFASGQLATTGDAQAGTYVLRGRSTGGAAVRLTADGAAAGSANIANIPNNTGWTGTIHVVARDTSTGDVGTWYWSYFSVSRKASASTIAATTSGSSFAGGLAGASGLLTGALSSGVDTTNGGLNFTFTPPNSNTWDVVAVYRTTEVQ